MKTQVVTIANRIPDRSREPYYNYGSWLASLRKFDCEPVVLGIGEPWGGLMTIPRRLRQWLRGGNCKSQVLIMSNCYDVIFTAYPDAVAEKWGGGDEVMFNAEKGLFPRMDLANAFPDQGTPWRYLNSGLYIGKPDCILAMLDAMNMDDICDDHPAQSPLHGSGMVNVNDQGWFQFLYASHAVPIVLDCKCDVFQSLSGCEWDEFDLTGKQIVNKVTKTKPLVFHANGGAKDKMLPDLCRKFGLEP